MDCMKHSAMIILTLMKDEDSCLQHLCWINIALTNRALVPPQFSAFFFFLCCWYVDLVSQSCHQHQTRYLFFVICKICSQITLEGSAWCCRRALCLALTNRRSEKNLIKWSSPAFSLGDQQTGARHYSHAAAFHTTRKCVIDVLENKVRRKKVVLIAKCKYWVFPQVGADHPGCKIVTHPLSLFALSTAREMSFCVCETSPTTINTHREQWCAFACKYLCHRRLGKCIVGKLSDENLQEKGWVDQRFSITLSFMSLQGARALI